MPDKLLVLGSSAMPTRQRFTSAYALTVAGKLFLLDCGAPVSGLLFQYGFDPIDVQAIFLSHWHMDHVAGLGLFLVQNPKSKGLLIWQSGFKLEAALCGHSILALGATPNL